MKRDCPCLPDGIADHDENVGMVIVFHADDIPDKRTVVLSSLAVLGLDFVLTALMFSI